MKSVSLIFALIMSGLYAHSQTASDSVKACITELFSAMRSNDSSRLVACFTPNAILQTIGENKEGAFVKNEAIYDFASSIKKAPQSSLDERVRFDIIKTDGMLASVWTPYSFYFKGVFSHCGVNSFQLIRTGSGWKIHYIIDTRRKQSCLLKQKTSPGKGRLYF